LGSRSSDLVQTGFHSGETAFEFDLDAGSEPVDVPFDIGFSRPVPTDRLPPAQCQVIAIASGKGGTGKTTFTTNLAITLSERGLRVLVIDADFGLANDHLLLGLEPHGDIGDVLSGRRGLRDVLLTGPGGMHLLPGGMGSSRLSNLENHDISILARDLGCLEPDYDVVLVDLAAGISPANLFWIKPAHEILVVTNPEVTAIIDAYGLIKCLSQERDSAQLPVDVVINRVRDEQELQNSMKKLRGTIAKHLQGVRLNTLGHIPFDRYLLHSIAIQEPVVLSHPRSFVTSCLKGIGQKLASRHRSWQRRQERNAQVPSYFALLERNANG